MNTPFPPPPAAPETPKRKLWPWFLGGCLLLLLLGGLAIVAAGYFGMKAMGSVTKDAVAQVPAVQEHFGVISDAGMDFAGMMEAGQTGQSVMAFTITGEKGEGRLTIQLNPSTQAFESATLTLPNGETRALDAAALDKLKALQGMAQ